MPQRRRRLNLKLLAAFVIPLAAIVAQDPTSYLTPNVLRVSGKLACRCGGCRNTVGNCPMLHCEFADPMRQRIYGMQGKGMSDSAIVSAIVREQGIVALAAPPTEGFGPVLTWVMPGIALLIGLWIYSVYVRRNRKDPEPLTEVDRAVIDRFHVQIERELGEAEGDPPAPRAPDKRT